MVMYIIIYMFYDWPLCWTFWVWWYFDTLFADIKSKGKATWDNVIILDDDTSEDDVIFLGEDLSKDDEDHKFII